MKKIIKRIAAIICVAVFTISNIVMPVAASFGIGVAAPLVSLVSYVLVSAGIISSEQASTYTDTQIINEFFRWSNDPLGTFGSTMAQIPIDDKMKSLLELVIGSLEYTGFSDWVSDSKDDVAVSSGDNIDMNGYGAVLINRYYDRSFTGGTYRDWYVYLDYGVITPLSDGFFKYTMYAENGFYETYSISTGDLISTFDGLPTRSYTSSDTWLITVYGDWRNEDGSPASDIITGNEDTTLPIGTVIIDGVEYPISDDGTVTIDGVTYTINDDGSITVDGVTYYPEYDFPVYDDTALRDLLARLLSLLDDANVPSDTTSDDIIDNTQSVVIADADFGKLTMDKSIATVFPFCIPWDFYNGLKLLSTNPVAPRFEVPFEIPQYHSFPGFKKMIVVDFSDYEQYFYIVRWGMFTIAMFGMCFLTFKIVKGA
ncbi:MAG: hypothetical protein MRZ61_10015 [Oscillospiraceae bacterium]|nr:hypothetical protein [Oscillospiraceae bacterium]